MEISIFFWLGLIICIAAIVIEAVADEHLKIFSDKKEKGELLTKGLWAYSRHPNYLGEISFWYGLYFFSLAASQTSNDWFYWWTVFGPVIVTILFLAISIPMIEKKMMEKYPTYKIYKYLYLSLDSKLKGKEIEKGLNSERIKRFRSEKNEIQRSYSTN